jgi:hypothetical protein
LKGCGSHRKSFMHGIGRTLNPPKWLSTLLVGGPARRLLVQRAERWNCVVDRKLTLGTGNLEIWNPLRPEGDG